MKHLLIATLVTIRDYHRYKAQQRYTSYESDDDAFSQEVTGPNVLLPVFNYLLYTYKKYIGTLGPIFRRSLFILIYATTPLIFCLIKYGVQNFAYLFRSSPCTIQNHFHTKKCLNINQSNENKKNINSRIWFRSVHIKIRLQKNCEIWRLTPRQKKLGIMVTYRFIEN